MEEGPHQKAWAGVAVEQQENLSVLDLLASSQHLCLLLIKDVEDPWCRKGWMRGGGRFLRQALRRQMSRPLCRSQPQTIRLLRGGHGFRGLWVEFVGVLVIGRSLGVDDKMDWSTQLIELMAKLRHLLLVRVSSRRDFWFRCRTVGWQLVGW